MSYSKNLPKWFGFCVHDALKYERLLYLISYVSNTTTTGIDNVIKHMHIYIYIYHTAILLYGS